MAGLLGEKMFISGSSVKKYSRGKLRDQIPRRSRRAHHWLGRHLLQKKKVYSSGDHRKSRRKQWLTGLFLGSKKGCSKVWFCGSGWSAGKSAGILRYREVEGSAPFRQNFLRKTDDSVLERP